MAPFTALLAPDCFAGRWIAREGAGLSLAGQATFAGCVVFALQPRADVEPLLPPELELAANTSERPDAHPLVFVFGDLSAGSTIFGGLTLPFGVSYREFALLVPYVQQRGDSLLHSYVPRMYSSYFPATWNGNLFYGLAKQTADMAWRARTFEIHAAGGQPLFRAALRGEDDFAAARAASLPELDALRELLRVPILGRKAGGAYVRSYFDWDFSDARVRRAEVEMCVDAPLADGLRLGAYPALARGTLEIARAVWRLSFPATADREAPPPRSGPRSRSLR